MEAFNFSTILILQNKSKVRVFDSRAKLNNVCTDRGLVYQIILYSLLNYRKVRPQSITQKRLGQLNFNLSICINYISGTRNGR